MISIPQDLVLIASIIIDLHNGVITRDKAYSLLSKEVLFLSGLQEMTDSLRAYVHVLLKEYPEAVKIYAAIS